MVLGNYDTTPAFVSVLPISRSVMAREVQVGELLGAIRYGSVEIEGSGEGFCSLTKAHVSCIL